VALSIDQAVRLVEQRALERAYLMVLLHVLEFDIDTRRILEQLRDAPFLERHSIRVEQSRETVQEQLALVEVEFAGAVALLRKAAQSGEVKS
jgi:hypothetical protein